jgi:selenocysteine lyase/cysteine desulfurase
MSKNKFSRRQFLESGAALGGVVGLAGISPMKASDSQTEVSKRSEDEAYWRTVAKNYEVTSRVTNLENGYWGIMALPVLREYKRLTDFINRDNTLFARFQVSETYRELRAGTAKFLNVGADEIALTRGATEALQSLIGGYNRLRPGDTVLYADLDYSEMKNAMRWLKDRRGVNPVRISFPEPTRRNPLREEDILNFYRRSLDKNPKTRLLLLTHLNNWTGLIIPVARIAAMAKKRGIDVILDAAHSVGQVDFNIKDLNCDFVGVNLHKWVGAPIGCGVIYISSSRVADIDTFMAKSPGSSRVTDRIDTGTSNFAAHMTIPAAIGFHNQIGSSVKEKRLRYLRNIWVTEARRMKGLTVLTPDDKKMVAGLTSFRLDGVTGTKANNALMKHLYEKFGILTTRRTGPAAGDCIRVTPSFYNTPDDMMKLVRALRTITASGAKWS